MKNEEFEHFAEMWSEIHEMMPGGKVFSLRAMTMIFDSLADYSLQAVEYAITLHVKQSRFAPTPHDIIEIINGGKAKHIGANEAWAVALKSMDERETVVWTEEMAKARATAWEVWITGDKIGARMAFIETYNRLIASAGVPVWRVCLGDDFHGRAPAVKKAVEQGLLPKGTEQKYLAQSREHNGVIAGLLAGKVVEHPNSREYFKRNWHSLGEDLQNQLNQEQERKYQEAKDREVRRMAFEEQRKVQLAQIENTLKQAG